MPRRCCPACFGDRGLRKSIIPALDPMRGNCDFCGSHDVDLVEPHRLSDVFELLGSVYEPNASGAPLVDWLKKDWQLFCDPDMDIGRANELLEEIFQDKDMAHKPVAPSAAFTSEGLAQWETLCEELLYKNRYFLDEALDLDRLKELLAHLPADGLPEIWHRARILTGAELFPIAEMGAPPKRSASHGRANPAGIPYLYLSSHPETAVAEIRPHTGEVACVAQFTIGPPLFAVDLRNPRKLVSPFLLAGAGAIGQLRADIPFLERLGEELTRPVLPSAAPIDYVPSQYLCEFIKKSGYDGVIYRSSVSDGMNLALFNLGKAAGTAVSRYSVTKVAVSVEQLA